MEIKLIINLREKEKEISQEVISLIKRDKPDARAIYLPNAEPKQKADYIFITMEPSFGKWARAEENAKRMIKDGFRNFLWSIEDFLFHFSIYHYLSRNYYITDISKVAAHTKTADDLRGKIYPYWGEHLKNEIQIIGNADAGIFLVGRKVDKWVRNSQISIVDNPRILGQILHYSGQAGNGRKDARRKSENAYKEFLQSENLTKEKVIQFSEMLLNENINNKNLIDEILNRVRRVPFLTESRKELIYTYYCHFTQHLKQPKTLTITPP